MATITGYLAGALMTVVTIGLAMKAISAILSYKRRVDVLRKFPQDPTHPLFGHFLHVSLELYTVAYGKGEGAVLWSKGL